MAKKEVAPRADAVPDYLRTAQVDAKDNFDASDVAVPQLQVLNGTSEVCTLHESAQPGMLWHSGADIPLGEAVEFVVVARRKKYLLLAPMEDGRGVLARSDDARKWDRTGTWDVRMKMGTKLETVKWAIEDNDVEKSSVINWGSSNPDDPDSPPAATMFYDYLVLLPEHLELGPVVLSVARSGIKYARKGLNDKIAFHRNAGRPMQGLKFMCRAKQDTNEAGQEYYVPFFSSAGFADEDTYKSATEMAETMADFRVKDEVGAAKEETSEADSDDY